MWNAPTPPPLWPCAAKRDRSFRDVYSAQQVPILCGPLRSPRLCVHAFLFLIAETQRTQRNAEKMEERSYAEDRSGPTEHKQGAQGAASAPSGLSRAARSDAGPRTAPPPCAIGVEKVGTGDCGVVYNPRVGQCSGLPIKGKGAQDSPNLRAWRRQGDNRLRRNEPTGFLI